MAFVVAATWKAKPGEAERVTEVIKKMTPLSRAEEGNVFYQAQVNPEDPETFFLYEQYKDAQAYEDHNQGLYAECFDNLNKYGRHLEQLLRDGRAGQPRRPAPRRPEDEAKEEQERFRARLSEVWCSPACTPPSRRGPPGRWRSGPS